MKLVDMREMEEEYIHSARGAVVPTDNVENAWLAAAEIAERMGYPCAAALVRYFVYGISYTEGAVSGTLFCPKIMSISLYSDYVSRIKQGLSVPDSLKHIT